MGELAGGPLRPSALLNDRTSSRQRAGQSRDLSARATDTGRQATSLSSDEGAPATRQTPPAPPPAAQSAPRPRPRHAGTSPAQLTLKVTAFTRPSSSPRAPHGPRPLGTPSPAPARLACPVPRFPVLLLLSPSASTTACPSPGPVTRHPNTPSRASSSQHVPHTALRVCLSVTFPGIGFPRSNVTSELRLRLSRLPPHPQHQSRSRRRSTEGTAEG